LIGICCRQVQVHRRSIEELRYRALKGSGRPVQTLI
jgi:hypothetical protein